MSRGSKEPTMLFAITHMTRYRYSGPVFLEPHTLRLRPRCDALQRLIEFRLETHPYAVGRSECVDLDGNAAVRAWFHDVTDAFTIVSTSRVESRSRSPFDFLLEAAALTLPDPYDEPLATLLAAYSVRAQPSEAVTRFAAAVMRDVGGKTVPFLAGLNQRIADLCTQAIRLDGGPLPPEVTLQERAGSCRDLAVLFMDACRSVGLAARFVSGYHARDVGRREEYMHAWAEVYLPGAGWRGFDPSQGLAVADRHVAVAAAATPAGAAPIDGTLRGAGVTATMQVDLELQVSDASGTRSQTVSSWAAVEPS